jgi:uncharacterized protein (TIGR01777 family)
LIGTALVAALRADGHEVVRLVRRIPAARDEFRWDPETGSIDRRALRGADAVVNLCGASIEDHRWTCEYKQQLRDSRIDSTDVLAYAVVKADVPTLVSASGVHYYGNPGDRVVDESGSPGDGFLAQLCVDWESATEPAAEAGTRVVLLRSGGVLSRRGGILGKLKPLFLLGLGGRLGSGRQYLPWISMEDEVAAIIFAITEPAVRGPINLVGPAPVTNAQFTRAYAQVLERPAKFVVPEFALNAVFGEFAREGILAGPRAIPAALENAGFKFQHNTIGEALEWASNR